MTTRTEEITREYVEALAPGETFDPHMIAGWAKDSGRTQKILSPGRIRKALAPFVSSGMIQAGVGSRYTLR